MNHAVNNLIEEDLSSIHQLEKGEFLITDPRLLQDMILAQPVRQGRANILTNGAPLTPEVINRLQELGVETVFARHPVAESVERAADSMEHLFNDARNAIFKEGVRTAQEAVEALKKGGRIDTDSFRGGLDATVEEIVSRFSKFAAGGVRDLDKHDQNTTLHSVEVALMAVEFAQALGWSRDRQIQAGLAGMVHDVGKAGVPLEVLHHPGRLDDEQWEAMEKHALIGYLILTDNESFRDVPAFCAGMHHERFSGSGRGYGIRTSKEEVGVDLTLAYDRHDHALAELLAICDVHSALGEARVFKNRKFPVELLMIMNLEAKYGKFNPSFYRTWYDLFLEKTPELLQKGYCFPLPSLKRRYLATQAEERIVLPVSEIRFTFDELNKLRLIPKLLDKGIRLSEIKRRDGMTLHDLKRLKVRDIPEDFQSYGIKPDKPVHYNIVAVEVTDRARAKFLIMKQDDTIRDLQNAARENRLDPIQTICLANRNLELDFHQEIICPV